jgi:hypothetical protein
MISWADARSTKPSMDTTTRGITKLWLSGLLAAGAAALALMTLGAAPAAAATPCWKLVLNDWLPDGRIDKIYPSHCYSDAQKHLGEDAKIYSSLPADLRRGLLLSLAQGKKKAKQQETGGQTTTSTSTGGALPPGNGGGNGGNGGGSGGTGSSGGTSSGSGQNSGFVTKAIRSVGPSDATTIPTPLLVLGGLAILLLVAALGSWLARRYHARRLKPAPVTPPPRPDRR